jgi:hypothetical protein
VAGCVGGQRDWTQLKWTGVDTGLVVGDVGVCCRGKVAVYIEGVHVGFVPAYLAPNVQPVVVAHARAGRR